MLKAVRQNGSPRLQRLATSGRSRQDPRHGWPIILHARVRQVGPIVFWLCRRAATLCFTSIAGSVRALLCTCGQHGEIHVDAPCANQTSQNGLVVKQAIIPVGLCPLEGARQGSTLRGSEAQGQENVHGLHHFPTVLCSKSPPVSLLVPFFHIRLQRGPSYCPSGRLPIVRDVWRSPLCLHSLPYCMPVPCNAAYCSYPTTCSLYSLILDLENKPSPSPTPFYLPGATTRPHRGTYFFFSVYRVSKHKTTRTDVLRPLATIYSNHSQHGPPAHHASSSHASR